MYRQKNNEKIVNELGRVATGMLDKNTQHLSAATLRRLSEARHQAVDSLTMRQLETAHGVGHHVNALKWLGGEFETYLGQHRWLSATVAMGIIAIGFFVTLQPYTNDNMESGDAFLLASELPPEAYADKGFDTWLVSKQD